MKKTFQVILLLCLCCTAIFAQVSKPTPKKKNAAKIKSTMDWEKDFKKEHSDCEFYNTYTAKQRLTKYPFSKATKVLAVSFKYSGFGRDEKDRFPKAGLYVSNGVLDTTTLIERKTLDTKQVDELTNLIFNVDYKKKDGAHIVASAGCFEPRNAFIFIGSDGQVFDYLEICFTCLYSRSDSDKIDIGVLCTQKYKMFSDYFKNAGVIYGTLGRNYHEEDQKE